MLLSNALMSRPHTASPRIAAIQHYVQYSIHACTRIEDELDVHVSLTSSVSSNTSNLPKTICKQSEGFQIPWLQPDCDYE